MSSMKSAEEGRGGEKDVLDSSGSIGAVGISIIGTLCCPVCGLPGFACSLMGYSDLRSGRALESIGKNKQSVILSAVAIVCGTIFIIVTTVMAATKK